MKRAALLLALYMLLSLLTGCAQSPKADYSFGTLYGEYWGKSEEEFLTVYPMDAGSWERTEETKRDFNQQKHNRAVYRSNNDVAFSGFPCRMEIAFTENYGMTNLYYVIKQENLSRDDYHQLVFMLYHELCGLFGEPGWLDNETSNNKKYWFDYDDADAFFDYLNAKANKQNGGEISVSWNNIAAEYPVTMVTLTSYMLLPYGDSGTVSLELRILRDITEGAQ